MSSEWTCQQCGVVFVATDHPSRPRKYCSRACRDAGLTTRVTLTCRQCGQPFQRKAYQRDWSQERGPFCGMACYGAWQKDHIRGAASPSFDPDSWKQWACAQCGLPFWRQRLADRQHDPDDDEALVFCSCACFQSFARLEWSGPGNPQWRGGHRDYRGPTWRAARRAALERDQYRCVDCSAEAPLVVHHVVPFEAFDGSPEANALDNLVTLCRACHLARHRSMAGWG